MAALRRSAIRARSYCVIAIGGCVVGAAEFIFDAVRQLRTEPKLHQILIAGSIFSPHRITWVWDGTSFASPFGFMVK